MAERIKYSNRLYKKVVSGEASFSFKKTMMQKFVKMCLPQDIWLYVLSAAIGGLISFLVTKLLNSSQNNAKRRQKIPKEHDERLR